MFFTKLKIAAGPVVIVGCTCAAAFTRMEGCLASHDPTKANSMRTAVQEAGGPGPRVLPPLKKFTIFDFDGDLRSVTWSPDGRLIAAVTVTYERQERDLDGKKVKVFIDNSTVKVWDVQKKDLKVSFGEEKNTRISHLAFAADNKTLAMIVQNLETNNRGPYQIRLADVESGNINKMSRPFRGTLTGVAFLSNGMTLVLGGRDDPPFPVGVIELWDVRNDRKTKEFRRKQGEGWPSLVALSADGKLIATAESDKTVKMLDADSGRLTKTLEAQSVVADIIFSRDGKLLATTAIENSENSVTVWEVRNGNSLRTLHGVSPPVFFSPDGKTLLVGHQEQNRAAAVRFWDIHSGELRDTLRVPGMQLVSGIAFSPDGITLLIGASRRTEDGSTKSELTLWSPR